MQRVRTRRGNAKTRKKTPEPLAEGVIPLNSHGYRDWKSMSDKELAAFTKRFTEEKGISGRGELKKADKGLYCALYRRKLIDRVGFGEIRRNWGSFSDADLVKHARKFMEENGISGKGELQKADSGLYTALRKRKLLDKVGFEEKIRKGRDWKSFSDAELVEQARRFMREKGISGKREVEKADSGLYGVLRKRKLLDRVGFEKRRRKYRDWKSLSDAQLIEHAKQSMEEEGIHGRGELSKADSGLYWVLRKRKLLDRVFEDIDDAKEKEEAQALFDGLMEFGGAE